MAANGARGGTDPSEEELQLRRLWLAQGVPAAEIALHFKRKIQTIKNQAWRERDQIDAIKLELYGEVGLKTRQRWSADVDALLELREYLIDTTLERRANPDLPDRDFSRYNRDLDQMVYKNSELAGLLTTRVQAQVEQRTLYQKEIVGFDDSGSRHEWADSGSNLSYEEWRVEQGLGPSVPSQRPAWVDWDPEDGPYEHRLHEPDPESERPVQKSVPPEHAGTRGRANHVHVEPEPESEPVSSPSPPYVAASDDHPLMDFFRG